MRIDSTAYSEFQSRVIPELIECDRINLVKPMITEISLAGCFKIYSDKSMGQYNLWRPVNSITEIEDRIELFINQWNQNIRYRWLLELKTNDEIIGDLVIVRIDERWNEVEIGFNLSKNYQKKGYMKEALFSLMEYSINHLGFNRFTAFICAKNTAAIKLVEKLNFIHSGTYSRAFQKDGMIDDIKIWQLLVE